MDKRRSFRSFTEILLSFSFRILLLIGLLFLILQGMNVSFRYGHGLFYERAMEKEPGREIQVEIRQGESRKEIAENLLAASRRVYLEYGNDAGRDAGLSF